MVLFLIDKQIGWVLILSHPCVGDPLSNPQAVQCAAVPQLQRVQMLFSWTAVPEHLSSDWLGTEMVFLTLWIQTSAGVATEMC